MKISYIVACLILLSAGNELCAKTKPKPTKPKPKPHPTYVHQQSNHDDDSAIVEHLLGIVAEGINIGIHAGDQATQVQSGVAILGHLGSLIAQAFKSGDKRSLEDFYTLLENKELVQKLCRDLSQNYNQTVRDYGSV